MMILATDVIDVVVMILATDAAVKIHATDAALLSISFSKHN